MMGILKIEQLHIENHEERFQYFLGTKEKLNGVECVPGVSSLSVGKSYTRNSAVSTSKGKW